MRLLTHLTAINPILVLTSLLFIQACSVKEIKRQSEAVTSVAEIIGEVTSQRQSDKPIYVQIHQQEDGVLKLIFRQPVRNDGTYSFSVLPGTYSISAFADENNDGEYTKGEWGRFYGDDTLRPQTITVGANEKILLKKIVLTAPVEDRLKTQNEVKEYLRKSYLNIGRTISLEDKMFHKNYVEMGVWKPLDFATQIGGGLMMLEAYSEHKTPLLFVHGMFGSSTEFSDIINSIDRDKYQPWILYYPSGVSLDIISEYLTLALHSLQQRYQYHEIGIIAHSMGGVMLRSYVIAHQKAQIDYQLKFVVTINSPMGGLKSAARGVKNSPIVIPAWIDLVPDGDYITRINAWRWPSTIPYYLIFSYLPGQDGDGIIPLNSQLSLSLQEEALKTYGFEAQHSAILKDPVFIDKLNAIMNQY